MGSGPRSATGRRNGRISPRTVCEAALAHTVRDKTEAAYRRTDLFEKRRDLMYAWARYATADPERGSLTIGASTMNAPLEACSHGWHSQRPQQYLRGLSH